jgi:glycosyltransferase involved in cell wall biosynthesis
MTPLVSFIIPYYNAGETIQETIDSIFNQSYPHYDVWIINDGSTDPLSVEKLNDFDGNKKINILHQENAGPCVARNKAIKLSKAEFIIPLDADDLVENHTVSDAISISTLDKNIGVVYGNLEFFGKENGINIQETFNIQKQLLWNQIAVCCLIRKNVFDDVGFYDEYLSKIGLEDWEFWIRVGCSNWKFEKMESIHFQIRISSSSRTFDVANQNLITIKEYVYKKHANVLIKEYEKLFYSHKMLLETPDIKIGKLVFSPYRYVKKKLFRND